MSKTLHFDSYCEFLARNDKSLNGTSGAGDESDSGNIGCWNCFDCYRCSNCSNCSDCYRCSDCSDCSRCYRCSDCSDCSRCYRCSDCSDCSDCSRCRMIKTPQYACFVGLYRYVVSPRIDANGTQRIQMGCYLRTRAEWEADEWNNPNEFPNDGSPESDRRHYALTVALGWLDRTAALAGKEVKP